jgi:hypothetical protein
MPHAEPFTFLFVRFVLTALLLGALVWWWRSERLSARDAIHAGIAGSMIHGMSVPGAVEAAQADR